jgi:hypothetical protein
MIGIKQLYADIANYIHRCSSPSDWAKCFLETGDLVQMILVTIGIFGVVSFVSIWRSFGQRAKECPSTAVALVVASFLWPPATLIIHEIAAYGINSMIGTGHPSLFSEQMIFAALSIVLLNPIVILFGVPVLLAYLAYLKSNQQFPFAAIYIAFTAALALQAALYWGMHMH